MKSEIAIKQLEEKIRLSIGFQIIPSNRFYAMGMASALKWVLEN